MLYYKDGTGNPVEPNYTADPVTGFPWLNQSHQNGGIAIIGDSIAHNPRVNSGVGLNPDKGDWNAKVNPTSTTAVEGYSGWYRSEFTVEAVKTAFGSSFGYMDQISIWMTAGMKINARDAKLYYVDGSGKVPAERAAIDW